MKIARIAIVEDIEEIRNALCERIGDEEDLSCVGHYGFAEDALIEIPKIEVDVVLMDIGLPFMNGIECMLRIKQKKPDLLFLMFTVFEQDTKVFEALKSGANGYILKEGGTKGAIDAIRNLLNGGAPMSRVIAKKVLESFHKFGKSNDNVEKLTARQIEILQLLSQGLLYKEVAQRLSPQITEGGLKQHINRIYKKLSVNNRTEAINKWLGHNRV